MTRLCDRDRAGALCCGVVFENDAASAAFLAELCSQVLKQRDQIPADRIYPLCHRELLDKCNIDLEDVVKSDVDGAVVDRRLSSKFHGRVRAHNLTRCLEVNFGIDENLVRAKKSYHRPIDVFYPRKIDPPPPPYTALIATKSHSSSDQFFFTKRSISLINRSKSSDNNTNT